VLVATGGAGQCFAVTTNPALSTGDGIAMAMRAGAAVADLEFMQFHPTALHHPSMPRPLLSEALRGEGAILRDERGMAFMADEHPLADLAPRDVVAKAISRRLIERDLDHLWLDATAIDDFSVRFPTIWSACRTVGLDPTHDWLPVAPAAHYLSGGVCTDLDGATTLPGLWACGEAACTGVHGANRLASNSLLEGLVFSARAVEAIRDGRTGCEPTGVLHGVEAFAPHAPRTVHTAPGASIREELQRVMTRDAGVVRSAAGLERAAEVLGGMSATDVESANLLAVSTALVRAAMVRRESRGTHTRSDFPSPSNDFLGRLVFTGGPGPEFVPLTTSETEPSR
jgi:L-aspartate oxidase